MRKFLLLFLIPILAYAIDRDVTSRDGNVVVNGFSSIKNQVNGVDKLTINSAGLTLGTNVSLLPGLGTALLPSYSFTGDPNTGVWSPGADTWAVSTNGTERLRIDSAGNITNVGSLQTYRNTNTGGTFLVGHGTAAWTMIGNQVSGFDFSIKNPAGSAVMYFPETGGNVLVGTTATSQRKIVVKSSTGTSGIGGVRLIDDGTNSDNATLEAIGTRVDGNTSTGFGGGVLLARVNTAPAALLTGTPLGRMLFGGSYDGTIANTVYGGGIVGQSAGTWSVSSAPTDLLFYTTPAATAGQASTALSNTIGTERMRIDSAGVVKITNTATAAPGGVALNIFDNVGSSTSYSTIQFTSTGNAASSRIGGQIDGGGTTGGLVFLTGGATPTEKMRIDSTGNIGVGRAPNMTFDIATNSNAQVDVATYNSAANNQSYLFLDHVRGSIVSPSPNLAGDEVGRIYFRGYNNAALRNTARISSTIETMGATNIGANLAFFTGDSVAGETSRLTISGSGVVAVANLAGSGTRPVNVDSSGNLSAGAATAPAPHVVTSTSVTNLTSTFGGPADLANATLTITTTGRPVHVFMWGNGTSTNQCGWDATGAHTANCYLYLYRDTSTLISREHTRLDAYNPGTNSYVFTSYRLINMVDVPTAGTHTYNIKWQGGLTDLTGYYLSAIEL